MASVNEMNVLKIAIFVISLNIVMTLVFTGVSSQTVNNPSAMNKLLGITQTKLKTTNMLSSMTHKPDGLFAKASNALLSGIDGIINVGFFAIGFMGILVSVITGSAFWQGILPGNIIEQILLGLVSLFVMIMNMVFIKEVIQFFISRKQS